MSTAGGREPRVSGADLEEDPPVSGDRPRVLEGFGQPIGDAFSGGRHQDEGSPFRSSPNDIAQHSLEIGE